MTTYTFQPSTGDNTINVSGGYQNRNDGGDTTLKIYTHTTYRNRIILKFDVSSQVPVGATITSATLSLYLYGTQDDGPAGRTYYARRLTEVAWVEGTDTWVDWPGQVGSSSWNTQIYNTLAWTNAGGTYTTTDEASASMPATGNWASWTVTAQVQTAVDSVGRVAHFIIMDGSEGATYSGLLFYSKEYAVDTTKCPKLVVTYTVPQVPTPTLLPVGGTYTATQNVVISDIQATASIYYTEDGSVPDATKTLYAGAVSVLTNKTLKAIAIEAGYLDSAIASEVYVINLPPTSGVIPMGPDWRIRRKKELIGLIRDYLVMKGAP
jgi:hypothetical protein